jgi:ABC-type transporter Mla MlaB component
MLMKKRTKTAVATKKVSRVATTKVAAKSGAEVNIRVDLIELPAECTVEDAGLLKERLMQVLGFPQTVTLDCSAVQRIDTATLQMLVAFARDRRAEGLPVDLSGDGAAFKNAASLLGLSSLL